MQTYCNFPVGLKYHDSYAPQFSGRSQSVLELAFISISWSDEAETALLYALNVSFTTITIYNFIPFEVNVSSETAMQVEKLMPYENHNENLYAVCNRNLL